MKPASQLNKQTYRVYSLYLGVLPTRTGQQAANSSTRALSRASVPIILVVTIYTGICSLVNVVYFCLSLGGAIRVPYALFCAYKFEIMQGYI